mgnify:CR=1 FL=1
MMRRIREFILSLVSATIVLLGVAFAFIELRLILSGDWLLYNTALAGFLQYFLRFIMSISLLLILTQSDLVVKKNF